MVVGAFVCVYCDSSMPEESIDTAVVVVMSGACKACAMGGELSVCCGAADSACTSLEAFGTDEADTIMNVITSVFAVVDSCVVGSMCSNASSDISCFECHCVTMCMGESVDVSVGSCVVCEVGPMNIKTNRASTGGANDDETVDPADTVCCEFTEACPTESTFTGERVCRLCECPAVGEEASGCAFESVCTGVGGAVESHVVFGPVGCAGSTCVASYKPRLGRDCTCAMVDGWSKFRSYLVVEASSCGSVGFVSVEVTCVGTVVKFVYYNSVFGACVSDILWDTPETGGQCGVVRYLWYVGGWGCGCVWS